MTQLAEERAPASATEATAPCHLENADELSHFCEELFRHLPRSDQRRWAEVYTRGLITVPGRKSIRRISDHTVGRRADQCLQQFVNQSPWRWEPVRRGLAHRFAAAVRPRAWLVEEVVFPKNGDRSAGVSKQYSTSARRMLNCQLGLAVLIAGDDAATAVDWRLMLPPCWDGDAVRRTEAHVPPNERHVPRWQSVVDAVAKPAGSWQLPAMPVVMDARHATDVEPLLRGLEERGLRYLIRVGERTPARPATPFWTAGRARMPTVGELVTPAARPATTTMNWRDRMDATPVTARFSTSLVPCGHPNGGPARISPRSPHRPARSVLAEWPASGDRPRRFWINNLGDIRLPDLIALTTLPSQATMEIDRMRAELGLRCFEGRSFRGWHHHVTLVSAAHLYRTMQHLDAERMNEAGQLRPRA
jgi:SRSO17 transposase